MVKAANAGAAGGEDGDVDVGAVVGSSIGGKATGSGAVSFDERGGRVVFDGVVVPDGALSAGAVDGGGAG